MEDGFIQNAQMILSILLKKKLMQLKYGIVKTAVKKIAPANQSKSEDQVKENPK